MITAEHIEIYKHFNGSPDWYFRATQKSNQIEIPWSEIDELVQQIRIMLAGQASNEFQAKLEKRIEEAAIDVDVRSELENIAGGTEI